MLTALRGDEDAYGGYAGGEPRQIDPNKLVDTLLSGQRHSDVTILGHVLEFSAFVLSQKNLSQASVIHAHDWHTLLAAVAIKQKWGIPFVLHLHSCQLEREGRVATNWIYELEQWGINLADKVICVSHHSAKFIGEHYSVGQEKLSVVHNALSSSLGFARSEKPKDTVLFAGRLSGQKSPELMVEIFRKLLELKPDSKLLIAGDGELTQNLRAIVEFHAISDSVELLGKVPYSFMPRLYERASVLCLPSVAEPFGLVALEAASCGLKVILSDSCGVIELLGSASCVSLEDIPAWVQHLAEALGANSPSTSLQKEAASRSWQDTALEILDLYQTVWS